jgi:hypothetical protein
VLICLVVGACGGDLGNAPKRLRTAIEAQQDGLDGCYGKTLEHTADAAGSMSLLIRVKSGQVTEVAVTASEIEDPNLDKCVKTTLQKVQLDPPPDTDFEVEYTVRFRPGEG